MGRRQYTVTKLMQICNCSKPQRIPFAESFWVAKPPTVLYNNWDVIQWSLLPRAILITVPTLPSVTISGSTTAPTMCLLTQLTEHNTWPCVQVLLCSTSHCSHSCAKPNTSKTFTKLLCNFSVTTALPVYYLVSQVQCRILPYHSICLCLAHYKRQAGVKRNQY